MALEQGRTQHLTQAAIMAVREAEDPMKSIRALQAAPGPS